MLLGGAGLRRLISVWDALYPRGWRLVALQACSNCGHYYVTAGERGGDTRCPYCRGETLRVDPHDEKHFLRLLRQLTHPGSRAHSPDDPRRAR